MPSNWPGREVAAGSLLYTKLTSCKFWETYPVKHVWPFVYYGEFLSPGYAECGISVSTGSSVMACSCSAAEKWPRVIQTSHSTA